MTHQVGNLVSLGWVEFDFGYSTVCQILLGLMRVWQKGLSSWAGWVEHPNQNQPNPVTDLMSLPVQGGWGEWPTGNGKKLSSCQAQLGQATCLTVA